ncbi:hypothetical protein LTR36_009175 [Oleoguttula mirabilis]|uniref:Major facilitator superfamily (MFS) profile domain-containing protein n=1 Tax=Oleoguttula mirabilis TaxID=1507867 RepID=A0AAV9J6C5_9PEZI|nr:hypothetical protein LTR36_009175 [Oleoguttula mirabilis]
MAPRPTQRRPRAIATLREHDVHADLHWEINALDPQNWSSRKRWLHTLTAAAVTYTITFASSIVSPARYEFESHFKISPTAATLPFGLFVLGLAIGPFIARPCSAVFGHKSIYIIFLPLFAIFTLASGLVHTSYGLILCRLLAGLFASPVISAGCETLSDIWKPEERTLPLTVYYAAPLLGPMTGVLVGGFVTQHLNGRWTQFVVLFAFAACVVPIIFVSETSKVIILLRKQGTSAWVPPSLATLSKALLEPLLVLFTTPAILLISLYSSINIAVMYASLAAFPNVFHSFDLGTQGLTFLGMIIGSILALAFLALNHLILYKSRVAYWKEGKTAAAERAMAAKRRTNRSSHQSNVSNFSRPNFKRNTSHTSLAMSLKRMTTSPSAPPVIDQDRNVNLAVAAANYLNSLPVNEGRRILPERIQLLLNKNPAYGDLCTSLESYHLKLDRIQFANVLVDALPTAIAPAQSSLSVCAPQSALARSKSLHRSAAAAALDAPAKDAASHSDESWPFPAAPPQRMSYVEPQPIAHPPPAWRLWPALPASILLVASLFMFGWTAQSPGTSWVAPCFAMGIFAFAIMCTFVTTQLYIMDRHVEKDDDGSSALAGGIVLRYSMSFAFVMFAEQMYDALGAGWATSVFAFVALVTGVVPWVLVLRG